MSRASDLADAAAAAIDDVAEARAERYSVGMGRVGEARRHLAEVLLPLFEALLADRAAPPSPTPETQCRRAGRAGT